MQTSIYTISFSLFLYMIFIKFVLVSYFVIAKENKQLALLDFLRSHSPLLVMSICSTLRGCTAALLLKSFQWCNKIVMGCQREIPTRIRIFPEKRKETKMDLYRQIPKWDEIGLLKPIYWFFFFDYIECIPQYIRVHNLIIN